MKRSWVVGIALVVALMGYVGVAHTATVSRIFGIAGECDRAFSGCLTIPTQGIVVCPATSGTCPLRIAGDYVVDTRMWGTRNAAPCRVSNDRGITWSNCPTMPEPTATSIAGAGDGSVIVVGTTGGGTNCKIQRSTDGANSWTTVFDMSLHGIGGACSTGSQGSMLKCTIDGQCVFLYDANAGSVIRAITSTDFGASWTFGGASTPLGANIRSMAFDGIIESGIGGLGVTSGGLRAFLQAAASWNATAVWAGTGLCWGSVIYNGSARGLCSTTSGTVVHTLRAGATGLTDATLVLPGGYPTGDASVGINGMSIGTNVMYIIGTVNTLVSGQLQLGVWASRDNLASIVPLFSTNQPSGPLREGDVLYHQGCIWFSGGNVAPMIGKVC